MDIEAKLINLRIRLENVARENRAVREEKAAALKEYSEHLKNLDELLDIILSEIDALNRELPLFDDTAKVAEPQ